MPAKKNWQQHTLVKSEKKHTGDKGNYKEKFRWNYSNKATNSVTSDFEEILNQLKKNKETVLWLPYKVFHDGGKF